MTFHLFTGAFASCRHPKPGQFMSKKQNIPSVVSGPFEPNMAIDSEYICTYSYSPCHAQERCTSKIPTEKVGKIVLDNFYPTYGLEGLR